jgi:hypothetical protein
MDHIPDHAARPTSWRPVARTVTAVTMAALLLALAWITVGRADDPVLAEGSRVVRQPPSAVQVLQVYGEGAFWAVVIIGLGLSAYIASREPAP